MLLLTNCEIHAGKYLDHSFEVRTERSEKNEEEFHIDLLSSEQRKKKSRRTVLFY